MRTHNDLKSLESKENRILWTQGKENAKHVKSFWTLWEWTTERQRRLLEQGGSTTEYSVCCKQCVGLVKDRK